MKSPTVDPRTLQDMLSEGEPVTVLDVRPDEEWAEWAIPGSIHVNAYAALQANEPEKDTIKLDVSFLVQGKQPELWDAVTGNRWDLPEFRTEKSRTVVPLKLTPAGSCFVVFRRPDADTQKSPGLKNFPELKKVVEITGSWTVAFDNKLGGPGKVTFEKLEDWTRRPEPETWYQPRCLCRARNSWLKT